MVLHRTLSCDEPLCTFGRMSGLASERLPESTMQVISSFIARRFSHWIKYMPSDHEVAYENLQKLITWADEHDAAGTRNEATTRLHLIDRILFECLGWPREECVAEDAFDGTYTDYSLGKPGPKFVVEAKKEGIYFELPNGFDKHVFKLATLARLSPEVGQAIEQALRYCQSRGVPIGAVCNGHQLIVFIASRQDGVPPQNGLGLIFASLESMKLNFLDLWRNVSKPGINAFNLYASLRADPLVPPPEKLSRRLVNYPGFKNRNELQGELKILGDLFIEDIVSAPENEEHFLQGCYCPSGALSQYALISRQILETRYSMLFEQELQIPSVRPAREKSGLAKEIPEDILAASLSRRPIILLGDVGVGKTIFIRHFIKLEAKDVLQKAVVLYLNFGREPALAKDLEEFVLQRCSRQLLEEDHIDVQERGFVRGVYHFELQRFSKSFYADLKKIDEAKYLEKELEFLDGKVKDLAGHLRSCLEHIAKGQKRQIVIFLDNIDQRPFEFQEKVFLIANSIAETWPGTVFVSLRPDTFFQSRQKGSLTAYQPRVFTISPPRVDLVISRRLEFTLAQLESSGRLASFPSGLTLNSATLSSYVRVLMQSFEENRDLMEFIDNVCGGNIRLALNFLTQFVGSGHVYTQKIFDALEENGEYTIPLHEFMRAVIYGDHEHYDPSASPIPNVFDISGPDPREHFLLLIILGHVGRLGAAATAEGYVATEKIFGYCQRLGFQPTQIQFAIDRAHDKRLLEGSARFSDVLSCEAYRITTVGGYMAEKLVRIFAYVDAMIVDTPIVDDDVRAKIRDVTRIGDRLERAEIFRSYLDRAWNSLEGKDTVFDWVSTSKSLRKEFDRVAESSSRRRGSPWRH
jgi:hypothetical protein